MDVFAYRNLNRKGVVWSIKDRATGRVAFRLTHALFEDVDLKVSQKGRERVLRDKRKNVHAGVSGRLIIEILEEVDWVRASYNPYKDDSFVLEDGTKVSHAKYAKLTEEGLFVSARIKRNNRWHKSILITHQ